MKLWCLEGKGVLQQESIITQLDKHTTVLRKEKKENISIPNIISTQKYINISVSVRLSFQFQRKANHEN